MNRCTECRRILIPRAEWERKTDRERKNLNRTHARAHTHNLCIRDYNRLWKTGGPMGDLGFAGEWVRDGLIWRAVA